jgi:hypothetical protein
VIYLVAGCVLGLVVCTMLLVYAALQVDRESRRFYAERSAATEALLLELAHKVSAPDQASVDHVFGRERERRAEAARQEDAQRKVDATQARLRELGVDDDELTLREVPDIKPPA